MIKKVLILGGSSDIGLELAKNFTDKKHYELHLHYNFNSKILKLFKHKCNFIKADLSDSNYQKILKKFDNNYDILITIALLLHVFFPNENFNLDLLEENYIRSDLIYHLLEYFLNIKT